MLKVRLLGKQIIYIVLLGIFVLALPTSSFSQEQKLSKEVKRTFDKGKKHYKKKEYSSAILCFLDVYGFSPNHINNLYFLTKIYNYELENDANAYKYGDKLLKILQDDLKNLDPYNDKKEYKHKQDLVDEIELIVYYAKPGSVTVEDDNISGDSLVMEQNNNEENSDDILEEQTNSTEDNIETQQDAEIIKTPVRNSQKLEPFVGIALINSKNNVKEEITEAVTEKYNSTKQYSERSYEDVLQNNADIQLAINRYNTKFIEQLRINEANLFDEIYRYNTSLYRKDSIELVVASLNKQNRLLNQEINSLNDNLEKFRRNDQISSLYLDKKDIKQKVFIGRYKIDKSFKKSDTKRLLNEILSLVHENTDFYNPKINSFVTFINSFDDTKYLYLITKIIDFRDKMKKTHNSISHSDIEVFVFESRYFTNIVTKISVESKNFGLKADEYQMIQGMTQYVKNGTPLLETDTSYIKLNETHKDNIERQLQISNKKFQENLIKGDTLKFINSKSSILHKNEYNKQLEKYNSHIDQVQSFANYLVINEDLNNKSVDELYSEMTDEVIDFVFENFENEYLKINRILPYADSSSHTMQIKYIQDSVLLKPSINRYEILSLSKIRFDNSENTYYAIDLGFVIDYTMPENMASNDGVSDNSFKPSEDRSTDIVEPNYSDLFVGEYQIETKDDLILLVGQDGKRWKALIDNPSSYTSYMMFQQEEGWRLPTLTELNTIITYLASNKMTLNQLGWPNDGAIYLSNENLLDKRNNKMYKAVKFSGSFLTDQEVEGGDEVFLIVIKE